MNKFFKSSTLNTWFAIGVKSANVILFLPLIFTTFSTKESELWLIFSVFLTLQNVADFGFYNTFVRNISYAFAGAISLNIEHDSCGGDGKPNVSLLRKVVGTMNVIYLFMTILVLFAGFIGTFIVWDRISDFENSLPYIISWFIFVVCTALNFSGRIYSNILYGFGYVYLVRRWEGIFAIFSIATNIFILIFTKSFLFLTVSYQFWIVVNIFRNRFLAYKVSNKLYLKVYNFHFDREVFNFIWPLAWKSGVSSLASTGVLSISGIWYSTLSDVQDLGSYLYTTKLLDSIRIFCKAPFYSKIPLLSQLRSKKDFSTWYSIIFRSVILGNYIFVCSIILLELFGPVLLDFMGSNVDFPSSFLWLGLGLGFFFHINGAFHTHIFMTSNKVNSHINDIISGLIFGVTALLLVPKFSSIGFVYAQLLAYGLFYIWFSIFFSRKLLHQGFLKFMFYSLAIPCLTLLFLILYEYL